MPREMYIGHQGHEWVFQSYHVAGARRLKFIQARVKDLDQIQLHDLLPHIKQTLENQDLDVEKPGLAQHYCVECARYFEVRTRCILLCFSVIDSYPVRCSAPDPLED